MKKQLNTPVLLLAFKRPDTTKLVFERIRKARPKKFFIHVDGPRNEEEKKKVEEVKKIVSQVDWPCKLKTFFRSKNKGLSSLVGAYQWFFKHVPEGIILEDDAIPNQDFFRFCEEMLEKYRNEDRIMHITGCNFQKGKMANKYSYYFSIFPHTYGFAMWANKREKYDPKMKGYLKFKEKINKFFPHFLERKYIRGIMDYAYYKNPEAVDTKWMFSFIKDKGLCIIPNKNLVQSIGFSKEATNTKPIDSFLSIPTEKIKFPLKHPPKIVRNGEADKRYVWWMFWNKIKKYFLLKTGLYKII